MALIAVGDRRGAHELGLAAHLELLHALGPTGDDVAEREGGRPAMLLGGVEDGAVDELALVVDLDRVGRGGAGASAGGDALEDQARRKLLRARLLGCGLLERSALLLLLYRFPRLGLGCHRSARLHHLLDLGAVGGHVHERSLVGQRVADAGLDRVDLGGLQAGECTAAAEVRADADTEGVEGLGIFGGEVGFGCSTAVGRAGCTGGEEGEEGAERQGAGHGGSFGETVGDGSELLARPAQSARRIVRKTSAPRSIATHPASVSAASAAVSSQ